MPLSDRLLAWVKPHIGVGYMASFISARAKSRAPASRTFTSPVEAKEWVEREASELGAPVEWVDRPET